jgi:hypothetical protein
LRILRERAENLTVAERFRRIAGGRDDAVAYAQLRDRHAEALRGGVHEDAAHLGCRVADREVAHVGREAAADASGRDGFARVTEHHVHGRQWNVELVGDELCEAGRRAHPHLDLVGVHLDRAVGQHA